MKIYRLSLDAQRQLPACIATIGNFDGVHRGHQQIIERLKHLSRKQDLPVRLICFEPHPQEFFAEDKAPARLTPFQEKMRLLKHYGVDEVLLVRFTHRFAHLGAEEFIERVLWRQLQVKHLVVGDDFRFGRQRQGDFAMLGGYGKRLGFTVEATLTVEDQGERISSTRIRLALSAGKLVEARQLLGHAYCVDGHVIGGDQRGRQLGFPTANIAILTAIPLRGVFAVRVSDKLGRNLEGVANIGYRPSFSGEHLLLEVHLFSFNEQIYGEHLLVEFVERIRDEKKFDGLNALIAQIDRDKQQAIAILANT